MSDIESCLKIAKEILVRRYPTLHDSVIETLAQQAVAKPIEPALDGRQVKAEIDKRITQIIQAQFPHLIPRREGRGGFITVGGAPPRGTKRAREDHQSEIDPEHSTDIADARLSKYALDSTASPQSVSAQDGRERAQDLVEEALQQLSPVNQVALGKILDVIEPEDSLREIARKSGLHPPQVSRALNEARDALEGKKPRRPVDTSQPSEQSRVEGLEFNPPTVPAEHRMRVHDGAMMPAWADLRTTPSSNGHPTQSRPRGIFSLTRPRSPVFVEHPLFGRGAILKDRSDMVDIEFDKADNDGKRRRTIQRDFLKFSNGNGRA
jgi:hypothetical protein